jgi:hypothetical protein
MPKGNCNPIDQACRFAERGMTPFVVPVILSTTEYSLQGCCFVLSFGTEHVRTL